MPTRDTYQHGVPSWADLATSDVEGSERFYQSLFGWEYQTDDNPNLPPYSMALKAGKPAAGIGQAQSSDAPPVWSTYFAVDDADESVRRIQDAGGAIVMGPMDIEGMGRMALASDPTGAIFGIWQAGGHNGAGVVNEHGALSWNELLTDDVDRARGFYSEVFGHDAETGEGVNGPYTSLKLGDRPIAGAMPKPSEDIPNNWGVYFAVDDLDAALDTTRQEGGSVTYGPMEIPEVGSAAGITDPAGAHLTVIELAGEAD